MDRDSVRSLEGTFCASISMGSSFLAAFSVLFSGFGSLRASEANDAGESTKASEGWSGVLISNVSTSLTNAGLSEIPPSPGTEGTGAAMNNDNAAK